MNGSYAKIHLEVEAMAKKEKCPTLIEAKITGTNVPVYIRKSDERKIRNLKVLEIKKGIRKEVVYEF